MRSRTIEQQRMLVANVTKAVCESIDTPPSKVQMVLLEMDAEDCATAGILLVDKDESHCKYSKK